MNQIKIKINGTIVGYKVDQVINVAADKHGTPLDQFWRRRLKDAEIDHCCEVVKSQKTVRSKDEK